MLYLPEDINLGANILQWIASEAPAFSILSVVMMAPGTLSTSVDRIQNLINDVMLSRPGVVRPRVTSFSRAVS